MSCGTKGALSDKRIGGRPFVFVEEEKQVFQSFLLTAQNMQRANVQTCSEQFLNTIDRLNDDQD